MYPPLPKKADRVVGEKYMHKGEVRIWNGRKLLCEHGKRKSRCRECGGSQICEHGKRKDQCRECTPSAFCEHGKQKAQCRQCGGSQICEHGKWKAQCRQCGGSAFCKHGKYRAQCRECGGSALCPVCNMVHPTKRYVTKEDRYVKMCADCFYFTYPDEKRVPTRYKRRQHYIHEKLTERFGIGFFEYDVSIQCSSSGRIPDWFRDCFHFVLNFELDENQHKDRDSSCEQKRLMQLFQDCGNRPFKCLRFNPDKYRKQNGDVHPGCFTFEKVYDKENNVIDLKMIVNEEELDRRLQCVFYNLDRMLDQAPTKEVEVLHMFYDGYD